MSNPLVQEFRKNLILKTEELKERQFANMKAFIDKLGDYLFQKMLPIMLQFIEKCQRVFRSTGSMPSIEPLVQQLNLFCELVIRHASNQLAKYLEK